MAKKRPTKLPYHLNSCSPRNTGWIPEIHYEKTRKDFYLRMLSVLCLGHLGSYQDVPKWRAVYRKEADIKMWIGIAICLLSLFPKWVWYILSSEIEESARVSGGRFLTARNLFFNSVSVASGSICNTWKTVIILVCIIYIYIKQIHTHTPLSSSFDKRMPVLQQSSITKPNRCKYHLFHTDIPSRLCHLQKVINDDPVTSNGFRLK